MKQEEKGTVLVVHDEAANLDVLFEHLVAAEFRVLIAEDGKSALRRIRRFQPDIILLDILPDTDGFALCRRLKEECSEDNIPVIFLSALTDTADKLRGLDLSAVDCITKPFHPEEVVARVEKHLTIRNLQKQLKEQNVRLQKEITKRGLAEAALQENEEKFRSIVEYAPVGISTFSLEGKMLNVNQALLDILGYSEEELIRLGMSGISHPEDMKKDSQLLQEVLEGKRMFFSFEKRYFHKKGHVIWGNLTVSLVRDTRGNVLLGIGVLIDTTERRQAEEQLQRAKETAEAANRAKSTFLTNMSHELRTPLNAILGYAQVLKRDKNITIQENADIIWQSGYHLLNLINDILDLSKVEAGKTELYPEKIPFSSFLDSVLSIIQMWAWEKNIEFIFEPDQNLPHTIEGDAIRLRQVLLNLLGNAVKFTDKGSVTLRVSVVSGGPLQQTADRGQQTMTICFEVKDTGAGMTPDQMEKIFLPFEQAGDIRRRAEGTGLGLAISRQLVRLMGGEIHVLSELNKGSCFRFEAVFPVASDKGIEPEMEKRKMIKGYKGEKQKILITDDIEENYLILQSVLEPLGFETDIAENGSESIRKAVEFKPDVILMDLVMPEMTGFEAAQNIREMPELKDTPIIAVSASLLDMDPQGIKEKGFDAFLLKPIDMDELFAVLKKYLPVEWRYEEASPEDSQKDDRRQVFDLKEFQDRMGGDEAFCENLVGQIPTYLRDEIENLKAYLNENNAEMIKMQAHNIKRTAGNIAAHRLSDIAYEIELAGEKEEMDKARLLMDKLEQEAQTLLSVLHECGLL